MENFDIDEMIMGWVYSANCVIDLYCVCLCFFECANCVTKKGGGGLVLPRRFLFLSFALCV